MQNLQADQVQKRCTRFLGYHYQPPLAQVLSELAASAGPNLEADRYGAGELIAGFEQEIANLLGKPAAVFMPSGTMCQPIALRIWADRHGVRNVAFHPTCHLEIHEHKGYQLLHGLHGVLVGSPHRLMTLDDLRAVADPLAALLVELPQREIGGQLPAWEDLVALTSYARERGIAAHLDGARLWECQPFYARPYAEIAALFDTVYVSFYKILGGIAGAVLAGPADVIAEARIWQRRQGGNLVRLFPYVLSARQGLARRLDRMAAYHRKAIEVAATLGQFAQIAIVPDPPHTNMMHLFIRGDRERLIEAALEVAHETGVWLFGRLVPSQLPAYHKLELTVGDATLDLNSAEIAELFDALFRKTETELS
jgi:threonine aldolase